MPFCDESVPHPQVDERRPGDGWQNLSETLVLVTGPLEHRHRSPGAGQSDGRCGSGWASPDYGDIKSFVHRRCAPGWKSAEVARVAPLIGTLSATVLHPSLFRVGERSSSTYLSVPSSFTTNPSRDHFSTMSAYSHPDGTQSTCLWPRKTSTGR